MNHKGAEALKEYHRKIKAGEIERPKSKNPLEKYNSFTEKEKRTKLRAAINAMCWECSQGQISEITNCAVIKCPLWFVRPYQK